MIKKSLILLSVSAAFYMQAQDVSVIKNTADIYSNTNAFGTAKYNAMAGSMGALGGDVSTINVNPAGLGVFITGDVAATLNVNKSTNTTTLGGKSTSFDLNKTDLGQVGGVAVFETGNRSPWKFVNVGFNYSSKSIEDYVESPGNTNIIVSKNLIDGAGNPVVGNLAYLGHAYNRYGNQAKMNLGIGGNYQNKIYVGGAINIHSVNIEQYDSAKFNLDLDNSNAVYDKQYTPFSEEASGFSASIGVIGKVNNQLRIGAALETPTWYQMQRLFTEYSTNLNGYISKNTYNEDRSLTSPMRGTISAAYVPNKSFALNLDYTVGLSKPKYKVMGPAETELNDFFSANYKNTSEIKVGAEYRVQQFRLRGGYAMANNPFNAITVNSYNDAGTAGNNSFDNLFVGKRQTIGAGIGYDFKSFYLDAAFQNINTDYSNPFLKGNATYASGYYSSDFDVNSAASAVSKVNNKRNVISITAGWKF